MNNTLTPKSQIFIEKRSREKHTEFLKLPLILNSSCWLNPCNTNKQGTHPPAFMSKAIFFDLITLICRTDGELGHEIKNTSLDPNFV